MGGIRKSLSKSGGAEPFSQVHREAAVRYPDALIIAAVRGFGQNDLVTLLDHKPVAKIVPYGGAAKSRVPGSMKGEIRIAPDFDDLPDDMAEAFGMREPGK